MRAAFNGHGVRNIRREEAPERLVRTPPLREPHDVWAWAAHAGMDHGHPHGTDEGQILPMGDCLSRIWRAAREEGGVEGAC